MSRRREMAYNGPKTTCTLLRLTDISQQRLPTRLEVLIRYLHNQFSTPWSCGPHIPAVETDHMLRELDPNDTSALIVIFDTMLMGI
jgi:hypothetical protein